MAPSAASPECSRSHALHFDRHQSQTLMKNPISKNAPEKRISDYAAFVLAVSPVPMRSLISPVLPSSLQPLECAQRKPFPSPHHFRLFRSLHPSVAPNTLEMSIPRLTADIQILSGFNHRSHPRAPTNSASRRPAGEESWGSVESALE